jgi:transposase
MKPRQERGLAIANRCYIPQQNGFWLVPSQSGQGRYRVLDGEKPTCNCPDYETRGEKCKHIFAVEYIVEFRRNSDGLQMTRETLQVSETRRPSYPQNWPAYNAAQTNEKRQFQSLLHDLCSGIAEPQRTKGRPRIPLSDAVFAATFKIYSTFSGRRFITDLRDAQAKGFIQRIPHYNSIFNYLENPELTLILTDLITRSALPLKAIENEFAIDSTGFMTSRFTRWFDKKYGTVREEHDWVKAHIVCGVKTNVVTAVEIQGQHTHDSRLLPTLINHTAKHFQVNEVLADKGYSSARNLEAVLAIDAMPYIAFNTRTTGRHGGGTWEKMFHYFSLNQEQFFAHYHKRSNVESTVMMIKTKFRDHVRSKTDVAMKNEVLCKILCHNICCLISAVHELGISPTFLGQMTGCPKTLPPAQ